MSENCQIFCTGKLHLVVPRPINYSIFILSYFRAVQVVKIRRGDVMAAGGKMHSNW